MTAGRCRCTGKASAWPNRRRPDFFARLPIVIVRPPNVLGAGQRELLAVMKLLRRRIVPMIGRREKQTSICFVQDLVRALVLAAEHDRASGRTYFVAADEAYSWREIMAQLLRDLDMKFVAEDTPSRSCWAWPLLPKPSPG